MKLVSEFREFIARGNVIDLAVGVIIGGAFGGIVKSLVDQVIMPPIGLVTGGVDFSGLKVILKPAHDKVPEVAILYGSFLNTVITFVIVAGCVFLLVKAVNKLKRHEEAKPAAPSKSEVLLTEIRDLLKK